MRVIALLLGLLTATGAWQGAVAQAAPGGEVTKEMFDAWMSDLSNWGRWGPDDQLGALNLITPEKRVAAARLVQAGRTVSMARPMPVEALSDADASSANRPPRLGGSVRSVFDGNAQYFWERYEVEYHGGEVSHFDALCHVSYDGRVYNGLDFATAASAEDGCVQLGVGNIRDGLVTRGVLVDLPGTAVRREHIERWEAETGIRISAGDALFLRTGRDAGQSGGYHPSLLPFFRERDIALLGADVPQEGGQIPGVALPVHIFALVALGVPLFDNLGLEELARTAREFNRWEFLFMAAPHGAPNGAGAALNPIAVF